jgi:hypothetical protein
VLGPPRPSALPVIVVLTAHGDQGVSMYGDTEAVRALAQRMRRLGEELRAEADAVLRAAVAVLWVGEAGSALRAVVRAEAAALRRCAGRHDTAARALERHAEEVERRKGLIAAAEARAASVVRAVGSLVPPVLPPPGHRDWLSWVPGL